MTMFLETPIIAAQAATEMTGAATTAGTLTGAAPAMLTAPPMGAEEVSAMLASAAAAHGGQFLAAAGTDGSLRVWDTSSGDQRDIEASDGLLLSVAVSPDGDRVATGSLGESLIRIWDRRTGTEAQPALTTSMPKPRPELPVSSAASAVSAHRS